MGAMALPYHEAFWGAMCGVASAVVVAQVIAAVVGTRSERWTDKSRRLASLPSLALKRRALLLQFLSWAGYLVQTGILAFALASLALGFDAFPPMDCVLVEIPVILSLPTAMRLAEDLSHELERQGQGDGG
jgi:hypothetical protein